MDHEAEARQSAVLGTYDHLAKAKVWIERAQRGIPDIYRNAISMLNEALVEPALHERAREEGSDADSVRGYSERGGNCH